MFQSPGPLSVGNVVSAALRLYRDRFQSYFGIAFRACLWSLIPTAADLIITYLLNDDPFLNLLSFILSLYCSAKYFANVALIARLVFAELINKPETIQSAQHRIVSKPFRFLLLQIYIVLIILLTAITLILAGRFINFLFINFRNFALINLLIFLETISFFMVLIWMTARFFIAELPLAVEENLTVTKSLKRSWILSQGYVWKIISIIIVAFLVTLPVYVLASIPLMLWAVTNSFNFDPANLTSLGLVFGVSLLIFILLNVLAITFWQGIKSVIYYDLRSRREGLGLDLADSPGDSW